MQQAQSSAATLLLSTVERQKQEAPITVGVAGAATDAATAGAAVEAGRA